MPARMARIATMMQRSPETLKAWLRGKTRFQKEIYLRKKQLPSRIAIDRIDPAG